MTVTLTDQLVGQLVGGRYQVLSRIARGGMATVYLATDQMLGRNVALKVMHPHLAEGHAGEDFVARFRREAKSAARLAHPGLVAVFDQGQDGDTSYLVMEYIEGSNLRKTLVEEGPLPVGDALQTVEAVLEALAVAHAAGVIHRDIKPENVLVAADGSIKVADFGLARAMAEASSTSTGTVLGSVAYLAPELVTYGTSDERTDLYSVGVLLYELITGHQPFTGTTPLQIAYQHVNADVPPPSSTLEWLPPQVDVLVARLSSREPNDRPANAAAALGLVRKTRADLNTDVLSRRAGSVTRRALLGPFVGGLVAPRGSGEVRGNDDVTETLGKRANRKAAKPVTTLAPTSEEQETRSRRRWLIPVAAAAALALGMTSWWYTTAGPGADISVPAGLLGANLSDAEAALDAAGLAVSTERVFHPTEPAGAVLTVSPAETAGIPKDGSVTLTVSKGPDLREVTIEAVGMPLRDVEDALGEAGFSVPTALHVYSDSVPAGMVISATVDGEPITLGAKYPVGTVVILTCSDGREPVVIPNVVGLTAVAAIDAIKALGLKPSQTYAYSDTVAAGIIKTQSPAAGTTGYRLDTVSFVVSKGPQPEPEKPAVPAGSIKVPYVIGKYKLDAWERLSAFSNKTHIDDQCTLGYEHCIVYKQYPAGGTYVDPDTKITIWIKDE